MKLFTAEIAHFHIRMKSGRSSAGECTLYLSWNVNRLGRYSVLCNLQFELTVCSCAWVTGTADLSNLATGSKSLGSSYLEYELCDIIEVYNFGS